MDYFNQNIYSKKDYLYQEYILTLDLFDQIQYISPCELIQLGPIYHLHRYLKYKTDIIVQCVIIYHNAEQWPLNHQGPSYDLVYIPGNMDTLMHCLRLNDQVLDYDRTHEQQL